MTPSKEAMKAFWKVSEDVGIVAALEAAYAIDVEPLEAERDRLQAEVEQFKSAYDKLQSAYDKLAKRANQLEYLVGSISMLLREDMTNG